jgi:hypothetical protein
VFDASTLSQNRRRRYNDATVAQDIFDAIVEQAIARGLVRGTVLHTDSRHPKANANTNRYDKAVIAKSRADYWEAICPLPRARCRRLPMPARCCRPEHQENGSRPRSQTPGTASP